MASLTIKPPADFLLIRDVCSYGYFLLAPNWWDHLNKTLTRPLILTSGVIVVRISQKESPGANLKLTVSRQLIANDRKELKHQLTRMLRLDESQAQLQEFHRLDPRFKASGRGRLFRSPTLYEDVIKTVTSCNVTWPSTIHMNERLCECFGPEAHAIKGLHAFPTHQKVGRSRPATLRARCRVGYRDARIVELSKLFSRSPKRGGLDLAMLENPIVTDDAIFEALIELPGIGPYAAANIMQLLGRYGRLPLDSESVRHGKHLLGMRGNDLQVMQQVKKHYTPFGAHAFRSYWFELWAYYEQKKGPAHSWDPSSTGKMFTAALLGAKTP